MLHDRSRTSQQIYGIVLRAHRNRVGLTQAQLARACITSESTISKIETGQQRATLVFAEAADTTLDTDGELVTLLGDIPWEGMPQGFPDYLAREAQAIEIRWYELAVITGLLQTPDYARALIAGGRPDDQPEVIDDLVNTRIRRQEILWRDHPPKLRVVMDEMAVRRPVGGHKIHLDQLDALIEAAERPGITIQMIPFATPVRAGLVSPFAVLSFADQPAVAYSEDQVMGRFVERPEDVRPYVLSFEMVRDAALPVDASLESIKQIREETT